VAKNPTDVTGRKRDELAAANAEALQERANEMSLATAEAKVKLETEVLDATKPNRATVVVESVTKVGKQDDDVVEIRVIADVENMTLGAGNNYTFKAGQKYAVTKAVANHLKEKGYLAGVI
jgi:hypothetical protein